MSDVTGLYDFSGSNQKLPVMVIEDLPPQLQLKVPAEVLGVDGVDPTVHEAEAVCRTYQGVAVDIQDRAICDNYIRRPGKLLAQCSLKLTVGSRQDDGKISHGKSASDCRSYLTLFSVWR